MTFATAGTLLTGSQALFAGQPSVTVDLGGITRVDSAGLALLLEWLRQARADGRTVVFQSVPDKLLAIARLSDVEGLLTVGYSPPASSAAPSSGSSAGSTSSR